MKLHNSYFNFFFSALIPIALIFILTINWWGCKTEEIVGVTPTEVTNVNLLGGKVILADYINDTIPLSGVKVEVVGGPTYFTDSHGTYWIDSISRGEHIIKYSKPGYTPNFTEIDTTNFRIGIPPIYLASVSSGVSIGIGGGIIQQNDMTLIIPPGAVESPVTISLNSYPMGNFTITNFAPLNIISINPTNLNFSKPVALSVKTPMMFNDIDSSEMKLYNFNEITFEWSESNSSIIFYRDSIRITLGRVNDNNKIIGGGILIPGFYGYWEVVFGQTWTFIPPPRIYEIKTDTKCAGPTEVVTVPPSVTTISTTLSVSATATLIKNIIALTLGSSATYTNSIPFEKIEIDKCRCKTYTRKILEDTYTTSVTVNICQFTLHGILCTSIYTGTISRTKYNGEQTSIEFHNDIKECHNQGGT